MPQKFLLKPRTLRKRIKSLREKYDPDIEQWACNLYMYCFSTYHSKEVNRLKKLKRTVKGNLHYPFVSGGTREFAMVYVYLLTELLKKSQTEYWEDAIFIIYLTYYTRFMYPEIESLDANFLRLVSEKDVQTNDGFNEIFKDVTRYNFNSKGFSNNNYEIKRDLLEKARSFKRKYGKDEKVELFKLQAFKSMKDGL